jgi:type IV pilus assembly protein PilF
VISSIVRPIWKFALVLCCALTMSACATTTQKEDDQQKKLAGLHYQLGVDALNKGLLPKAFDELMASNTMHPNQAEVLDALAYAWLLRGDLKKSESHYRKSLHIKARASTQNNYANLLNKMERFKEAESMARKALDDPRYPNQDLAFINLGDALLGQEKLDEAIRSYGQAQLFNSKSIRPQLKVANAYVQYNRLQEAQALYESLMLKHGNSRIVVMGMLTLLKKQNDSEEAKRVLTQFSNHATSANDKAWASGELEQLR